MSGCLILFKNDGTISKEAKRVRKYMERDVKNMNLDGLS